ncbi:DNA polymerase III subunit delta' [Orrella dioscoreae]|uniref:DNA polymerase III delta prime subunit n=1 Tax=Orrella dioscoreae TaxID=1851544 RepID=A0A1C3JXF7_9BURK|nr:DNA polymerase III subunit delta' [Orrella dioscoreae]SBT23834.1 DNA polymerase III delta prime subunit [Orrella dioscoreae]SOE49655.1 DNA polymerase III delta prime subunit [Orrella dioscoreae]
MTAQFLPWQQTLARQWLGQRERFAHAWLIHGLAGIGKLDFALAAAAALLCESPEDGVACGKCLACGWVRAGNHPDLRRIRPEAVALEEGAETAAEGGEEPAAETGGGAAKRAPSKDIRIEQIRGLESWFNTATHRGGWRVAVLYPAHAMNVVSSNALLKVLEEPPPHTVFLLVADAPDRLLPTLVSRCRRLPLAAPGQAESLAWLDEQGVKAPAEWLAAAGGAPLAALRLSNERESACPDWLQALVRTLGKGQQPDLGQMVEALEKTPTGQWLDALQRFFADLMLGAAGAPPRYFPQLAEATQALAARASRSNVAETARWLGQQQRLASHPLNAKLLLHASLQRVVLSCQG